MCNKKYSRRFIEGLIDSFLTEEIIPDILIDVFSGEKFLVSIMTHTFLISFLERDIFWNNTLGIGNAVIFYTSLTTITVFVFFVNTHVNVIKDLFFLPSVDLGCL